MKPTPKAALLLMAIAVAAFTLAAACGDDDGDGGQTPTPVPRTTCKVETPLTPAATGGLPTGVAEFQSAVRGYRVQYPSDWQAQANQVAVQNIAGDVLFAPAAEGNVKPNVSVTCETIPIGTDSKAYFEAKLEVLEQFTGQRPETQKTLQVDGSEAYQVEYSISKPQTPEPLEITKVEVYFANDVGGWTIALAVPKGNVEEYRAVFDAVVASYRGS